VGREHWHVTVSWENQGGLDVSPPLTRPRSARLLWLLVQETGGQYRDRAATRALAYVAGRYVFFARWPCAGQACAPAWETSVFPSSADGAAPAAAP